MYDDDEPPRYEDAHLFADQVAPMAKLVRDAFAGRGGMSRWDLLGDFRSPESTALWRSGVDSGLEADPGLTREAAVAEVRALYLGYHKLVAEAAGLSDFDAETYIAAFMYSFDLFDIHMQMAILDEKAEVI